LKPIHVSPFSVSVVIFWAAFRAHSGSRPERACLNPDTALNRLDLRAKPHSTNLGLSSVHYNDGMALKRESAEHLGYIDALRGIAILGVIAVHSAFITQQRGDFFVLAATGQRGVQLFYMVSAFTLYLSLDSRRREHHPLSNFFLRRFFRIAPLFYAAIVANLLLRAWRPMLSPLRGLSWPYAILGFLFLHGASPKDIDVAAIGGWSIAVETTFYLLLPFLHRHFKTVSKTLLLFVLAGLVCEASSLWLAGRSTDLIHEQYFAFLWFPVEFPVFVLGMLAYCIWKRYGAALQGKRELSLLLLFGSFMICWGCLPFSDRKLYPSSLVFLPLILSLSIHPWPILVNSFTRFVGKISYSIYLVHFFVIILVSWLLDRVSRMDPYGTSRYIMHRPAGFALVFVLLLGISVPLCMLSWRFIEQPGIRLGRRWISYREGKSTPAPSFSELQPTDGTAFISGS
jgi:peptidoglycan/LPS O-acetylase OafA/YrhL